MVLVPCFKLIAQFQSPICKTHFTLLKGAAVVQSPSRVRLFVTPWTAARQASLSLTISWSLPKFMFIALVMPSSHFILWRLPYSPSALNLFQHQGLFQWVSSLHQMKKILELQLQHQSFQQSSRLISLKIDWFDLLAVPATLRSLLQHHRLKASVLRCSSSFMVQLSQPYVTTGKTKDLCRQNNVSAFKHIV